jgi:hypothetical protein
MVSISEMVEKRRVDWQRLETLIDQFARGKLKSIPAANIMELSELYRSASADLAMAEQYRLSPETVDYLHGLVARAHNTLYRSQSFQYSEWMHIVFNRAPRQIFADRCLGCLRCRPIWHSTNRLIRDSPNACWVRKRSILPKDCLANVTNGCAALPRISLWWRSIYTTILASD